MRIALGIILVLHGIIHGFGLLKALKPDSLRQLSMSVSPGGGVAWGLVAACFITAGILVLAGNRSWWIPAAPAVVVSQVLLTGAWSDAKWGTLLNAVLLIGIVMQVADLRFRKQFSDSVARAFQHARTSETAVLQEADIAHLPVPVQRYIRYSGAIGKPRVHSFQVRMNGALRQQEGAAWMPFHSVQYNVLEPAARFFFLDATMRRMPVAGLHSYLDASASMDIRLFSLIPVQYQSGAEMDTAETVTFFNDMCCLAPGTLVDSRIRWKETAQNQVIATFTVRTITVAATLDFDEAGRLLCFRSNDRFATGADNRMHRAPWVTPLADYRTVDDHRLASRAEAIYEWPSGPFCYGRFLVEQVICNPAAAAPW